MTAALTRSSCVDTIQFSAGGQRTIRDSECQWRRLNFRRQTVPRWQCSDWKASWTKANCLSSWQNHRGSSPCSFGEENSARRPPTFGLIQPRLGPLVASPPIGC